MLELGLVLLFLLLSAILALAHRAFFHLGASALEGVKKSDNRPLRHAHRLLEHPGRLHLTLGLLRVTSYAGVFTLAARIGVQAAAAFGVAATSGGLFALAVAIFALLLVDSVVPYLLSANNYLRVATRLSLPLRSFQLLLTPLLLPLEWLVAGLFNRAGRRWPPASLLVHAPPGYNDPDDLAHNEQRMIDSVVAFGETTVREIMVSRMDMVALPVTASLDEALDIIRSSGYSRLPLYDDHLDNILGVVYTKDILPYLDPSPDNGTHKFKVSDLDWRFLARPAMFVPLARPLNTLLQEFRRQKTHLAIVVDEYGGTAGLVTLEDVLEEIVGDIRDEHDIEEVMARKIGPTTYRVDARMNLDDLGALLGRDLGAEEFEFETLGGLVYECAGDIPEEGDTVTYEDVHLTVTSVDSHRIVEVLVQIEPEAVMQDAED